MSMPTPCLSVAPTDAEVEAALKKVCSVSAFIDFRYVNQLPTPKTPSALAAKADTRFIGDPDHVKSWLGTVGKATVRKTKTDNLILTCRTMNRRAIAKGATRPYYGKGEFMWRTYRKQGIQLDTVEVVCAGKRYKLFPNAI